MGRLLKKKTPVVKKVKSKTLSADENSSTSVLSDGSSEGEAGSNQTESTSSKRSTTPIRKSPVAIKTPSWIMKYGFIEKTVQFLREVWAELKKVAWPSRKQALGLTAVVIIVVFIISMFLGAADMVLSFFVRIVLQQ